MGVSRFACLPKCFAHQRRLYLDHVRASRSVQLGPAGPVDRVPNSKCVFTLAGLPAALLPPPSQRQGGAGGGGGLALATPPGVSLNEQAERLAADGQRPLQRRQLRAGGVAMAEAAAPDETQSLDDGTVGRRRSRGYKRVRADAANVGGGGGEENSAGREVGALRCTRSCEGMVEQKKLRTESFVDKRQLPGATTKDGFVGDAGRWQQRLGIAVESECSSGSGGSGGLGGRAAGERLRHPSSATVTTAKDLMEDSVLKESYAARGRHKKSPVLAREV